MTLLSFKQLLFAISICLKVQRNLNVFIADLIICYFKESITRVVLFYLNIINVSNNSFFHFGLNDFPVL